jgi:hypothetical protein
MIEADLIDCMVELPARLFTNTQIPACLWFLSNQRLHQQKRETLFIDARNFGKMIDRKQRELLSEEITLIAETYHNRRLSNDKYRDIAGFCKSIHITEIKGNNYNLAPSIYVSTLEQEVKLEIDIGNEQTKTLFVDLNKHLNKHVENISTQWNFCENIKIEDVIQTINLSQKLFMTSKALYLTLINNYFLDFNFKSSNQDFIESDFGAIPKGWRIFSFEDLFKERKTKVEDEEQCPKIYSVTNLGIQTREGKYTKELSNSTNHYKIAYYGDIVFGLSRDIPNLGVFPDEIGAFSPAYTIYSPKDARIGLIVGSILRLKLMEQVDILKGGAREGKTLDKEKLKKKKFVIPSEEELSILW